MLPSTFGERLRFARVSAGLSARELGYEIDRKPRTIYRYEWGQSAPSFEHLIRLAARCDVRAAWLLDGEGLRRPRALDDDGDQRATA